PDPRRGLRRSKGPFLLGAFQRQAQERRSVNPSVHHSPEKIRGRHLKYLQREMLRSERPGFAGLSPRDEIPVGNQTANAFACRHKGARWCTINWVPLELHGRAARGSVALRKFACGEGGLLDVTVQGE